MARYDDLNVSRIALVGVISVVVTAVTALAVQVLFYAMATRTDALKAEQSDYRRQREFLEAQRAAISDYGVDPDTGRVTIPVDQAIDRLLAGEPQSDTDQTEADNDADAI